MVRVGGGGGFAGWASFEEGRHYGKGLMARVGTLMEGDECAYDVMHDIYP